MNFITDLSLCHYKETVYNACIVIVNHYTKMAKYISTTKIINLMELANKLKDNII